MNHIKKQTVKDRFGNQITYEFDTPKQVDPTSVMKQLIEMQGIGGVPEMASMSIPNPAFGLNQMQQQSPSSGHPGAPKGPDTVPAWLTPGEFVMNAEAVREFGPQIEAMNNHGRAIQKQQGGTIPGNSPTGQPVPQYHSTGSYIPGEIVTTAQRLPEDMVAKEKELMQAWKRASGSERQAIKEQLDAHRKMISPIIEQNREERLAPRAQWVNENRYRGDDYDIPGQEDTESYPESQGRFDFGTAGTGLVDAITTTTGGVLSTDEARERRANNIAMDEVMGIELSPHSGLDEETKRLIEGTKPSPVVPKSGLEYSEDMMMIPGGENPETAEQVESSLFDEGGEQQPTKFEFDGDFEAMRDGLIGAQQGVTEGVDAEGNQMWSVQGKGGKQFTTRDRTEAADLAAIDQGQRVKTEDPGLWNRVLGGFKDAFGSMLDEGELFKTALMYLGSRAMGYSHSGSLQWAGKQYLGNVQAKQKAEAAQQAQLAEAEREYNLKLAEEHRDEQRKIREEDRAEARNRAKEQRTYQADLNKHAAKAYIDQQFEGDDSSVSIDTTKTGSGIINGETHSYAKRVTEVNGNKITENVWTTGPLAGQPVAPGIETTDDVRDYEDHRRQMLNDEIDFFKDLRKQKIARKGETGFDELPSWWINTPPTMLATQALAWQEKNGITDPVKAREFSSAAYDAMNRFAAANEDIEVKHIEPFLNAVSIRKVVPQKIESALKLGEEGGVPTYVDAYKMETLNRRLASAAGVDSSNSVHMKHVYNNLFTAWGGLSDAQRAKFNNRAAKGETGFYVFASMGVGDNRAENLKS